MNIIKNLIFLHRLKNKNKIKSTTQIEKNSILSDCTVGEYTYIGPDCRLFGCIVGNYTSLGPRVVCGENEHNINIFTTSDLAINLLKRNAYKKNNEKTTSIGSDVWIGANVFIRKGVTISDGAIIGAGSIVLADVPAYSVCVGVPAKLIKYRFSEKTIECLKITKWWNIDRSKIQPVLEKLYASHDIDNYFSKYKEDAILEFLKEINDI